VRLTGFTEKQCRDILIEAFGPSFRDDGIPDYLKLLREQAEDVRSMRAVAEMRLKMRGRIFPVPSPDPCSIEGCNGTKVRSRSWRWTCSEGGLSHLLACEMAERSGLTSTELLAKLSAMAFVSKSQMEAQLEAWKESVNGHKE